MNKPDKFEKNIKSMLDESTDDLSPEISRRLQQARYAALEKAKPRSIWIFYPQAMTAMFAIAVISLSLLFNFNDSELSNTELAMESDIEMLTANESLDLMEDLEFIQWLVESEEYAS